MLEVFEGYVNSVGHGSLLRVQQVFGHCSAATAATAAAAISVITLQEQEGSNAAAAPEFPKRILGAALAQPASQPLTREPRYKITKASIPP